MRFWHNNLYFLKVFFDILKDSILYREIKNLQSTIFRDRELFCFKWKPPVMSTPEDTLFIALSKNIPFCVFIFKEFKDYRHFQRRLRSIHLFSTSNLSTFDYLMSCWASKFDKVAKFFWNCYCNFRNVFFTRKRKSCDNVCWNKIDHWHSTKISHYVWKRAPNQKCY